MNKFFKYSGITLVVVVSILILIDLAIEDYPKEYSSLPIYAHVVDVETNQPLSGVEVFAYWQLKGGLEGGNNEGTIMVLETKTDENGRFEFPAWGPVKVPDNISSNARLKSESPAIYFYKEGYEVRGIYNEYNSKEKVDSVRSWVATGEVIKLSKFTGSQDEYLSQEKSYISDMAKIKSNWMFLYGVPFE